MCEVRDAKYYSLEDLNFTPPNCRLILTSKVLYLCNDDSKA